jgi:hypothetical protein
MEANGKLWVILSVYGDQEVTAAKGGIIIALIRRRNPSIAQWAFYGYN